MQVGDIERILAPEGSDLVIQKANSDNLNWTWRVRYNNGQTGRSVTRTGADLRYTLNAVNDEALRGVGGQAMGYIDQ